jgi:hypothetical protein
MNVCFFTESPRVPARRLRAPLPYPYPGGRSRATPVPSDVPGLVLLDADALAG